ncbi:MAG: prepilin-type N-terminal cleavage/methylation domain-containing protein [Syntrophobacterales bacterium]|nr:prepilin-type N-terminal cleavage/methylation domain-containing protein [Syntrophobacterales bacterium]
MPPPSASRGFTLLELLLSLLLVSLLGLAAYGLLHLVIKGTRHGEAAITTLQQLRLARHYLERSLGSAVPQMQVPGEWPYFVGEAQEVKFLTPVPLQAHIPGGLYHLRVFSAVDDQGRDCLAVEEIKAHTWLKEPDRTETRLFLLAGLTFLRFTYLVGAEEFATWHADTQKLLPEKVRVELALADRKPHQWLIPLRLMEAVEPEEMGGEE